MSREGCRGKGRGRIGGTEGEREGGTGRDGQTEGGKGKKEGMKER